VVVPFVDRLAAAIAKSAAAPRILRDFSRLLALVKSVAVLRHRWRRVDESGRLVAEIADYETIRQLCDGLFADSVTEGASARVKEAVAAVRELCQERAQNESVTVAKVAKRLGISRSAATRRLGMAIAMGWVVNSEHRSRHPWILEPGEPVPEMSALPVLQAEANDENAVAPDDGGDAVHDPLPVTQPGSPPPTQVGDWLLDDLEDWQLSYIREAEAIDN
jgi:Winged helix-turn-helix DNA-binding